MGSTATLGADAPGLIPHFNGGVQMGYHMGMNGLGWPNPVKTPLSNETRSGFYIAQTRLGAVAEIDSGMKVAVQYNALYLDLQELYFEKTWHNLTFTAGKFRGAGLRSAMLEDEFERLFIETPFYSRIYSGEHRLFNQRDLGVQVEHHAFGGVFDQRFFVHNSSGQFGRGGEPSFFQGAPLQVLGFTYAWDLHLSPSQQIGGHLGILADREWDEFIGPHDFWEVTYWFKTNPMVDGSFYHEWSRDGWKVSSEGYLRQNRRERNAVDSSSSQQWAFSSALSREHSPGLTSFYRYEFIDLSDGTHPDDNYHLLTAGLRWKPSPSRQLNWSVTGEYVLTREENFESRIANDVWYLQNQWSF